MAHLLGAENIGLEYPTKVVFEKVTVACDRGRPHRVVRRNGDGKSTLLRLLAGASNPDSGRVTRRGGVRSACSTSPTSLPDDAIVSTAIVDTATEHEWAGDARIRDVISGLIAGGRLENGTCGDIPWDAASAT